MSYPFDRKSAMCFHTLWSFGVFSCVLELNKRTYMSACTFRIFNEVFAPPPPHRVLIKAFLHGSLGPDVHNK